MLSSLGPMVSRKTQCDSNRLLLDLVILFSLQALLEEAPDSL